jgi:DNA (cytosine-5)-methyltransferase 1
MHVVDLFSGCGGLSLGFEQAGFHIVAAFDNWAPAVAVYKENFAHPIFQLDLGSAEASAKVCSFSPDIIIGGPPCQDFSSAGKRNEDLGRGDLSVTYAQLVVKASPKYFVMENVERILVSKKLNLAKKILKDGGYMLYERVLDASLCGVPQKRKRFVMIGAKDLNPQHLASIIDSKLADRPMTIRDYMGTELNISYYYRHPRSYARRGIFSVDEPSPTIRGVNRPLPKGYPGHDGDACPVGEHIRSLTFEERSRIQTFPSNFVFLGNKSDREQMIGNAVPVNLGKFLGEVLAEYERTKVKPYHPATQQMILLEPKLQTS